jgi:membrane associated rhomboid family serine protease
MAVFSYGNINKGDNRPRMSDAEEKQLLYVSIFMPLIFISLMWLSKLYEYVSGFELGRFGILPRHIEGIPGILLSPFIHSDLQHLLSNSLPFFILGFLMIFNYRKVAFKAFVFIYTASGFMVWLMARENYHIGASNLVYGFAFFLFFSGVFRKNIQSIALSLFIVFLYGGIVWGVFPIRMEISWEGHLMGAVAGSFIAFVFRKVDLPPPPEHDEEEGELNDEEISLQQEESKPVPPVS